ncbi:MAG TPA: sodium:dicarboxylate symporter, partial [Candidatus Marinimicrobia bacterium]|nr:sodium:dicarboxylate symporter [Candidatus Neomarinimicrobiota bacterium]
VAIFMASTLFFIPTRSANAKTPMIMGSMVVRRLPWNIVLLFGGGFALAKGMQVSGLSEIIGGSLAGLENVHPIVITLVICTSITFLTELTSKTATTQMILPILASVAIGMHINPLLLMIPATLAASQAFMMPVATPPNAIVFGSERVEIRDMAKIGFFINLVGVLVITLVFYYFGRMVFGFDPAQFPVWAETATQIIP